MGQTLTHGIYLPDEGERNCYNGLASNWNILDGAVGTVADHTTALSGKAPLVHTHTKSDITDLFNSANTWSALNSYSNGQIRIKSQYQEKGVIPSSNVIQYLEFADKNDAQHGVVGLWDYANGASEIQMYISDKFKNGVKDPTGTSESTLLSFGFKADGSKFLTFSGQIDNSMIPKSNNTYDLGTSSYKWKSLNGINPGALSLPSRNYVEIGTTGWDLTGGTYNRVYINNANPTFPGILFIRVNSSNPITLIVRLFSTSGSEITYSGTKIDAVNENMVIAVPCPPSTDIYVNISASSAIIVCRYYTLLGDPEYNSRSSS